MKDNNQYCYVQLTCKDLDETNKITTKLLEKRLIVCAKQMLVGSDFLWNGKVDHNDEILLIMESREDLFEKIEAEVAKIHSYDTFVLTATLMTKISKKAQTWLAESLK